jgi:hypothetical protein
MSATTPQSHPSFEELFKHVDTMPVALLKHLDLSFLEEFPVFAPDPWGEHGNMKHQNCSRECSIASPETSIISKKLLDNSKMS